MKGNTLRNLFASSKLVLLREQQSANVCCYSSKLEFSEKLPSVEEALKTSAASVKVMDSDSFLIEEED